MYTLYYNIRGSALPYRNNAGVHFARRDSIAQSQNLRSEPVSCQYHAKQNSYLARIFQLCKLFDAFIFNRLVHLQAHMYVGMYLW